MFEQICDFKNLHTAYLKARKGKRYRGKILEFGYHLEENLLKLKDDLLSGNYRHGEYREFTVCDSKKRNIKAAPFRDRVVHHAVCNIIEPIFNKGFIYDSYACRTEKGTHKAVKRLQSFIRSADFLSLRAKRGNPGIYCLKCDVSKYFDSIDHKIL
ncbi:MAG: reverse transcriptase domain-containing protein [bacterium]|nr:reverse transcriptase domain-containing protein [bacterium]